MTLLDYWKQTGLSLQKLADQWGMPRSVISSWVYGNRVPSAPNIALIIEKTGGKVAFEDWYECNITTNKP
tara:strand:+ start:1314 stop:1523 length:210 start_codon:yes stop_codon:yes gene_type:complete